MEQLMKSTQLVTVAYDGSTESELALHDAHRLTEGLLNGTIHVVCVADELEGAVKLPTGETMTRYSALQSLQHIVGSLSRKSSPRADSARVYVHLRTGDAARAIVDLAYRYHSDAIVMGRGGHGGASPIGCVADEVLALSEIPVVLKSALSPNEQPSRFNALRFAYVFGGPELRQENFGQSPRQNGGSA
jgi:nucleotide-binding universal stress UspA family protein